MRAAVLWLCLAVLACEPPPAAAPDVVAVTGACTLTVDVTGMH
jgi:hypothetical protein